MRQICFRVGSREGSSCTQWLLSCYFKDIRRPGKGSCLSALGEPFSWVRWVGNEDRDGKGHISFHVASSFLGTWR